MSPIPKETVTRAMLRLSDIYTRLREALDDSDFAELRQRQRDWLGERDSCGSIASDAASLGCLTALIEERIGQLTVMLEHQQ